MLIDQYLRLFPVGFHRENLTESDWLTHAVAHLAQMCKCANVRVVLMQIYGRKSVAYHHAAIVTRIRRSGRRQGMAEITHECAKRCADNLALQNEFFEHRLEKRSHGMNKFSQGLNFQRV